MSQIEPANRKQGRKALNNDFFRALDECADALSVAELSRVSGVRIELLRRYLQRKVRTIRAETWDKIYPVLKPYIEGPEPPGEPPLRIGGGYRRHAELVEMFSAQKVLLDEFAIFSDSDKKQIIREFSEVLGKTAAATGFSSLNSLENQVMGIFVAMDAEMQDKVLADLTTRATNEVRRRRQNLF